MSSLLAVALCFASIGWQAKLDLVYDDNVFEYSPSDLGEFQRRAAPERYPFRSADDLSANAGFNLAWRYRAFLRPGALELRTRLYQHFSNWEKSYGSLAIEAGQGVWPDGRLAVAYLYLPNYLIRYYRAPGSADYSPCTFAEHLATVRFRQRIGSFAVAPFYRHEYDDYRQPFDHYDTRAHRPGLGVEWSPEPTLRVSLDYELKLARARGPVPDVSYRQHAGGVRLLTRPRRLERFSLEVGYSYALRQFTTANPGEVDPTHAGRADRIESADIVASYRTGAPTLLVGYEFEWRQTDSPFSDRIEDVKSYRASRVRLGVVLDSRQR